MTRLSRSAVGTRLAGLDPVELTAFVAAVYDARGWETAVGDGVVSATPPGEDESRRLVVSAALGGPGGADAVGADDLYELLVYAVDADQVGADAVAVGATVHVLFIEAETGRLYHTRSEAPGAWSSPTVQVDSATVQWVRGRPVSTGSSDSGAYGYVYDAGSDGGSGRNWYGEVPVRE